MTGETDKSSEELDAFIRVLREGRRASEHTLRAYRSDVERFLSWLESEQGAPALTDIRPWHVRAYVTALQDGGYARTTMGRKAAALRAFFRFLIGRGILEQSPADGLKTQSGPRPIPAILDTDQVGRLLASPVGSEFIAVRDRAILEFIYSTGARVSEAVALEWSGVSLREGIVRLFGKGRKERLAPLGRHAAGALELYRPLRSSRAAVGAGDVVFLNSRGLPITDRSIRRMLKKRLLDAGLPSGVTPHTLRHCFATHLLRAGAGLRAVQELLGHKSMATTQIYTRISPEHLRDVIMDAHPRAEAAPVRDQSR